MSSSRTVSIVFANLKGNVGDFAILEGMIRQMARRYPGQAIEVFSQSRLPVDEDRFREFREGVNVPFTYKGPLANLSVSSSSGLLGRVQRKLLGAAWVQGRQVRWAAGELEAVVDESGLGGHEAVFFPGGALWSGGELAVNLFGLLQALVGRGVAVYTFPFSVDRSVLRKNKVADLRRYFSWLSGPILVRDGGSGDTLGLAGVNSSLMPDVAFSLPHRDRPKPAERSRPRVGLAIAGSREPNRAMFEGVLKSLRAGGVDPVLVTTCLPEDAEVLESMAAALDLPLLQPLGWRDAVREFQALDLLLCNRLHGLVFAILGGTPIIPMVNREKVAGLARDAGLSRKVERLEEVTADAVKEWVREAEEVVIEMTRYRSAAQKAWDDITLASESPFGKDVA